MPPARSGRRLGMELAPPCLSVAARRRCWAGSVHARRTHSSWGRSPTSPFGGCTADDVASQNGVNYPKTKIEPWVDDNPKNQRNLIAGWQQDRWSNGGSRGIPAGVSFEAAPRGVPC